MWRRLGVRLGGDQLLECGDEARLADVGLAGKQDTSGPGGRR
jgi:hypothetical protein